MLQENPVLHLAEEEVTLFIGDYNFLRAKLHATHRPHHRETVKLLLQSLVYEFFDCIEDQLLAIPYSYSSPEMR